MKWRSPITMVGIALLGCEQVTVPDSPSLYSPSSLIVEKRPTFVWQKTGDLYQLQVATDSVFSDPVINERSLTDTTFVPADSLDFMKYYWRVRAKTTLWSEWSEVKNFQRIKTLPGLISPEDADTIKQPTLVWNALEEAQTYHLKVYQGKPEAEHLIINEDLTDTIYEITDTLYPATYYWMVSVDSLYYFDTFRFVTYTLDESFYPAGRNFKWEYMVIKRYWNGLNPSGEYDTSFSSREIIDILVFGDTTRVFYEAGYHKDYTNDSIFYGYDLDEVEEKGINLFPTDGDGVVECMLGPDPVPIHKTSDSIFWYGWPETYDMGYAEWYMYYYKRGVGFTECNSGMAQRYNGDPTQSYGRDNDVYLINFTKGE